MAAASLRFSANESDAIERKLEFSTDVVPSKGNLEEFYEIPKCVDVINGNRFHKVALQFPDYLLGDSTSVALAIKRETGAKVFVLADTSYGSCCVDEVAAEHVDAELIIHFGKACLSQTRRLPVLYIFGKWPVSIKVCMEEFCKLFPDTVANVLVFYDVIYSHCIEELQKSLAARFPNIVFTKLKYSTFENKEVQADVPGCEKNNLRPSRCYFCQFGREFWIPEDKRLEDYKVFYVGGESLCLTNLMMSLNKCQFYTYNPWSGVAQQETLNVNRSLMRRYYMIEKAKDAQVVGIVVGTLGVADYLQAIERLKQVIKLAGKKSYLFVMGKLNVAKMANFMEIDIFVLVACPENTLIDSQEFYKPIVTPFEMEIACLRTREWTGDYITDFRELLPGASQFVELNGEENRDDIPDISLVTGHIRPSYTPSEEINELVVPQWMGVYVPFFPHSGVGFSYPAESASTSLVQRNEEMTISTQHHTSGAEFLASRSWRGLEQKLGETPVTEAVEGRKGIAARYTHEEGSDV